MGLSSVLGPFEPFDALYYVFKLKLLQYKVQIILIIFEKYFQWP